MKMGNNSYEIQQEILLENNDDEVESIKENNIDNMFQEIVEYE